MNVVFAMLLSLVFPGAGQAYNGQLSKGMGFALFYLVAPIPLLLLMVHGQEWAMWTISGIKIFTPLVSLVDAGGRSYEIKTGKRPAIGGGWGPGIGVLAGGIALRYGIAFLLQPAVAGLLPSVVK